jgi:hypothetical protein
MGCKVHESIHIMKGKCFTLGFGMISILSASASTRRLIAFKFTHLPQPVVISSNKNEIKTVDSIAGY